jgi:hypothetical protein
MPLLEPCMRPEDYRALTNDELDWLARQSNIAGRAVASMTQCRKTKSFGGYIWMSPRRKCVINVRPCVTGHPAWRDAADTPQHNKRNNRLEVYRLSG